MAQAEFLGEVFSLEDCQTNDPGRPWNIKEQRNYILHVIESKE
jgi:hypothetical protein